MEACEHDWVGNGLWDKTLRWWNCTSLGLVFKKSMNRLNLKSSSRNKNLSHVNESVKTKWMIKKKKEPLSISFPFYDTAQGILRLTPWTHLRQENNSLLVSLGATFRTGCRNTYSTPDWCVLLRVWCLYVGQERVRKIDMHTPYPGSVFPHC